LARRGNMRLRHPPELRLEVLACHRRLERAGAGDHFLGDLLSLDFRLTVRYSFADPHGRSSVGPLGRGSGLN
jgi:hypothetical protein